MRVKIEWHRKWVSDVEQALATRPHDLLSEPELLHRLWDFHAGHIPLKVGIVKSADGQVVGLVPLKRRGRSAWQLLTYYCVPYCKLMVDPDYVDATLRLLARDVDCPNIAFPITPLPLSFVRPEESWIVETQASYKDLLSAKRYSQEDRRIRRKSAGLRILHDNYKDLPLALNQWHESWVRRGSPYTAVSHDELKVACDYMIEQGRLKTFSAYDNDSFVGINVCMIADNTAYGMFITSGDEYRDMHPGMRLILECLEWACASSIQNLDMLRSSGLPKHKWGYPVVNGYRLVRCPLGVPLLGELTGKAKDIVHDWRNQRTEKLKLGYQLNKSAEHS